MCITLKKKKETKYDKKKIFNLFFQIGQNALTLATYSGDRKTCELLLKAISYKELLNTSILTPMCTAVLNGDYDLVRFFAEYDFSNRNECATASVHGMCPLKLAIYLGYNDMQDFLYPLHCFHLNK